MPIPGMPEGCLGPSDIDHYAALGIRDICCDKCQENPCECCPSCSAGPDEACERWCGLTCEDGETFDDELRFWSERSELFAPPVNDYHGD